MYIWLSLTQINGNLALAESTCEVSPLDPPETSVEELRKRRASVMQILTRSHPELKGAESSRVYMALARLVESLPSGYVDLDFAIHLGMAHCCLPEAQRTRREHVIDAIIERYVGPPGSWPAAIQFGLERLRCQMPLLPDAMIEAWLSSYCGLLLIGSVMEPFDPTSDPRALADYKAMDDVVARLSVPDTVKNAIFQTLSMTYCLFPPDRRKSFVQQVLDPLCRKALPLLADVDKIPCITPLRRVEALVGILNDVAAAGLEPGDPQVADIVEAHIVRMRAHSNGLYSRARNETVEALGAGVPMGTRGTESRAALLKLRLAGHELNARLTPARLRQARTPPSTDGQPAGPTDMAPVHAWSVARLVRWIEGPLTERCAKGRLDRHTVVARERSAIEQDTKAQREAGLKAVVPPLTLSEDEVGAVMNDALAATARFFHDDIQEMAPLGKALGTGVGGIQRCLELQPQLRTLADTPASFDEEKARALLQDAEASLGELRKGIRVAEASAQLVRRFSAQLGKALAAENLVLGKRHGGVIACPLRTTDWAWVATMFHRRWLPQVTRLEIDGQVIPLQADQAVALYVTASSQSNHAFDVSVHLWQRRASCTGAPSELMVDCPPMNDAQWFDTYIPCAVLHVPPAD